MCVHREEGGLDVNLSDFIREIDKFRQTLSFCRTDTIVPQSLTDSRESFTKQQNLASSKLKVRVIADNSFNPFPHNDIF